MNKSETIHYKPVHIFLTYPSLLYNPESRNDQLKYDTKKAGKFVLYPVWRVYQLRHK